MMPQVNLSYSPDMNAFATRLHFRGVLWFETAHRVGAERSMAVDAPDLPVLRTEDGRPYIPGSSFKGAWRSYTEAVLRTVQVQSGISDRNLCCLSVSKPRKYDEENPAPSEGRCLTQGDVSELKRSLGDNRSQLDKELRQRACWVCRVFGSGWLASKALVKDIIIDEASFLRTEIRDGVAIDRDTGRAATGMKYQFEAVPSGARFHLEIMVENASDAELGLVMLGLNAFRRGEVQLGGNKSRGLGWCRLEPDWEASEYVTDENLLDYLLQIPTEAAATSELALNETMTQDWLNAFRAAITAPTDATAGEE